MSDKKFLNEGFNPPKSSQSGNDQRGFNPPKTSQPKPANPNNGTNNSNNK